MEAAATRGVHGDPVAAARMFIEVLDHWDRVGDWSQQWLNLRYVIRLMIRLGADDDAVALHHARVDAGKSSPLSDDQLAALAGGSDATTVRTRGGFDTGVVIRARSTLARYA